ncbi:Hcp family type VI secretion system effector [Candidatus Venteria ishoeyi]|uniref:Major exported protein n=1 Tax=Candidatus Venteria ishoeyi TaxID=1899563 RepID=A0A1H6FBD4_9GAMM|nr:type VI secretion system tube protein Hcp [Candidatus Venteria ishoeyi]MDM8546254.1 type VI secretion system tube protein Hcp [Candidatus Venteria ishoeyi]SEH07402.1 Uncharacterised protein [Candidatus Venteria ishoeyi]
MAASIYLKIYPTDQKGSFFKGNSQVKTHKEWIEIFDLSHSFTQPVSSATRSSELGPSARCNHEGLEFKKYNDNASDNLIKACWIGQCLDAQICIYRSLGEASPVYKNNKSMMISMKKAYISDYTIEPTAEDGGTETVKLVYNYIQYAFAELDFSKGKLKSARQSIDWDWTTNEVTEKTPTW